MSDKPEKKEAAPAAAAADDKKGADAAHGAGGGGGFLTKLPVLLGGVMVIEAAILFAGFKMFGGVPKQATAAELSKEDPKGEGAKGEKGEKGEGKGPADKKSITEIHVVDDFRSPNKVSGHYYFYNITIVATAKGDAATKGDPAAKVKDGIEAHGALIKDRIRTIIASSDPEKLGGSVEPGLETFRRQVKFQLDEIIGDGLIDEVLVPACMRYPGE